MNSAYTLPQKDIEAQNMCAFQNAISGYRLECAREIIKNADDSDIKELTMDIVSSVKRYDITTQNKLADLIEAWSINLNSIRWKEDVCDFCKQNADICSAYSVMFLHKRQLVIVVDDMTKDTVLNYNMFAFDLRNRYPEINDFMVIDDEAFNHIINEFDTCDDIYRRG